MNDNALPIDRSRAAVFLRARRRGLGGLALARDAARRTRALAQSARLGALGNAASRAHGEARDLPVHGGRAVAAREASTTSPKLVRLHGTEAPGSIMGTQRLSTMVKGQSTFPLVAPIAPFKPARRDRRVGQRLPAAHGRASSTSLHHSFDVHRAGQPRPGDQVHPVGIPARGPPVHGLVGRLRARHATTQPAVVRRHDVARQGPGAEHQSTEIWSSGFLPSHHGGVLFRAGDDAVLYVGNPDGITMPRREAAVDAINELARAQYERTRQSRDQLEDRAIRDGVSHAELGAGATDIASEPEHVLATLRPRRAKARHVRPQLPAGAAARRARREIHPALSQRAGTTTRRTRVFHPSACARRSADGRACSRT